jgi:glucose-1-phosphate cytidylyltransferase
MKVVILAGGFGTRLSEETDLKPKPMVEIGGRPILWHILKYYSHFGFNEFVICCGYKSYYIKEYFHHYYMHAADVTIDLSSNRVSYDNVKAEPWKVTLVDTGLAAMTGARIRKIRPYVEGEQFLLTYGDGVTDLDLNALIEFHRSSGAWATLTAVQPSGKFGSLVLGPGQRITRFQEKPPGDGAWINGGFFVLEPRIFEYIGPGDEVIWERAPLEGLARDARLAAYKYQGFWQCMDTLREKLHLEELWTSGEAPWKIWND